MPLVNLDFPFYYSILCVFLGALYAYFLYQKEGKVTFNKLTIFLFCLRTIFIAFLSFLLLAPVIKSKVNIFERPIVIIAKDNSKSIKQDFSKELEDLVSRLDDFDVFSFSFSDKTYEGLNLKNDGLLTNYSKFFLSMDNQFENRNVAALIMASEQILA